MQVWYGGLIKKDIDLTVYNDSRLNACLFQIERYRDKNSVLGKYISYYLIRTALDNGNKINSEQMDVFTVVPTMGSVMHTLKKTVDFSSGRGNQFHWYFLSNGIPIIVEDSVLTTIDTMGKRHHSLDGNTNEGKRNITEIVRGEQHYLHIPRFLCTTVSPIDTKTFRRTYSIDSGGMVDMYYLPNTSCTDAFILINPDGTYHITAKTFAPLYQARMQRLDAYISQVWDIKRDFLVETMGDQGIFHSWLDPLLERALITALIESPAAARTYLENTYDTLNAINPLPESWYTKQHIIDTFLKRVSEFEKVSLGQ